MAGEWLSRINVSDIVGKKNIEDTKEDREDFPCIPSAMVLPDGTMLSVTIRHLSAKKLKKKVEKRKQIKKLHLKKDRKRDASQSSSCDTMEDVATIVDDFFSIYNLFLGPMGITKKFDRIAKWLQLKLIGDEDELMEFESICKKEDAFITAKEAWRQSFEYAMSTINDVTEGQLLDIDTAVLLENMTEDLGEFFLTDRWEGMIDQYGEDPFSTSWFRDDNHELIDYFKEFLLKKYKTQLLNRYKTFLSAVGNPVINQLQVSVEHTLKNYLNTVLKAENEYNVDIKKIGKSRQVIKNYVSWVYTARDLLNIFLEEFSSCNTHG